MTNFTFYALTSSSDVGDVFHSYLQLTLTPTPHVFESIRPNGYIISYPVYYVG